MKHICPTKRSISCNWSNVKNNCKQKTCCKTLIHKNKIVSKTCFKNRSFCPIQIKRVSKRVHYKNGCSKKITCILKIKSKKTISKQCKRGKLYCTRKSKLYCKSKKLFQKKMDTA